MAELQHEAKRVYQQVRRSPWLGRMARIGWFCKGVVYILLGGLALMAALDRGGETTDPQGVIRRVANERYGELALMAIVAGLAAYVTWRFIAAVSNTEGHGSDAGGLSARAGHIFSGTAYGLIAVYAVRLLLNGNIGKEPEMARTWTAHVLDVPGGFLLVALTGLVLMVVGGAQFWLGATERFTRFLQTEKLGGERRWVVRAGKAGYYARGIVFLLIGAFLIVAGFRADPSEARGIEGVLDALAGQRYGRWMLSTIAGGLLCFGIYMMFESRYRRIPQ
jgi:hypothetical protein